MHVGVLAEGFVSWGGGVGFLETILVGLREASHHLDKVTVLVPDHDSMYLQMRRLAGRILKAVQEPSQVVRHLSTSPDLSPWINAKRQFADIVPNVELYDGTHKSLDARCRALGIDVLLPAIRPLRGLSRPWVGYIYDCQHRRLPEFFTAEEVQRRDKAFRAMLGEAKAIIVNAHSVVSDLDFFFPRHGAKLVALPFSPVMTRNRFQAACDRIPGVLKRLDLLDPYFVICNQFWAHKDHRTAIEAFSIFLSNPDFHHWRLVCTGAQRDPRFPTLVDDLLSVAETKGIRDRLVLLGYIDKVDQLALVRNAVAVIQPTLFEGGPGGGAVYDAVAMGAPAIVSDIPINREIDCGTIYFFEPKSAQELARVMVEVASKPNSKQSQDFLFAQYQSRSAWLGEHLLSALSLVRN